MKIIFKLKDICGLKASSNDMEPAKKAVFKKAEPNKGVRFQNVKYFKHIMRRASAMAAALAVLAAVLSFAGCGTGNAGESGLKNAPGVEEAIAGGGIANASQETANPENKQEAAGDKTSSEGAGQKGGGQDNTAGDNASRTAYANPGAKFPLKVADANGYEMTINEEPKRIVSLTLGSDEILMGLVDKSRIASLTRFADDPGISNIAAETAGVGERVMTDEIEKLIALKPDLVILDTWADANNVKQLRDAGINVYVFKTPNNIDEQMKVISEIAHVVGADEKGEEMISWMKDRLKHVEEKLAALKPEEKLTVMDYGEMGSSGLGTNFDDIVTRAGLVNVVAKAGMTGWPTLSKEKIIELNPDIIILPSWYYDKKNSLEGMINTLKSDKSLAGVSAIKNNRLISVPNPHISAISQYVALGVEDVAKAAYPELFD